MRKIFDTIGTPVEINSAFETYYNIFRLEKSENKQKSEHELIQHRLIMS